MSAPARRFARPPSVADYERMTQRARLAAAELVAAHIAEIEKRRDALAPREPQPVPAVEHSPEDTRELATALLARYQRLFPDPPSVKAHRLTAAVAEMEGRWVSGGRGGRLKAAS